MAEFERTMFTVWDYLVFALVLAVSAGIGIYYGCTGGKQKTTKEFLMANRDMNFIPVALSLIASFMSAITLLGTPAEIYIYGTIYWWIWIGYLLLIPVAAHFFLPIFYNLKLTSVYEYFELRFKSKAVRMASAITFSIQMVLYMSIVLYAPCLALNQVTSLNVWVTVVVVGAVCTFYTTLGGMKAVMWTDTFQVIMMFAGLLAVLIQGSINKGGFMNIWRDNMEGGRVHFADFDPDPLKRHTFWTLTVGGCFTWLAIYGVNQAQVQRALCVDTLRNGQIAMWMNLPGLTLLMTICGLCGMVIYSEYKDCDPMSTKQVTSTDQLLPFYVMENLNHVPGLPGLFVASLFSGALSTISSGLNSLAAVTLQDLIRTTCAKNITEERATLISKILAFSYGMVCMALTGVAAQLGSVLQAALALFGMIGGPLLGLFTLAMLFPCANWIGALVGLFTGLLMTFWVGIGAQIYKPITPKLPVSIVGCPNDTFSYNGTTWLGEAYTSFTEISTTPTPPETREGVYHWYELSYLHYGTLAILWVPIVGLVVSLITGPMKKEDVDPRTLHSFADVFCCCLPQKLLDLCRCNREIYEPEEEADEEKQDEEKQVGVTITEKGETNGKSHIDNGYTNQSFEPNSKVSRVDSTKL